MWINFHNLIVMVNDYSYDSLFLRVVTTTLTFDLLSHRQRIFRFVSEWYVSSFTYNPQMRWINCYRSVSLVVRLVFVVLDLRWFYKKLPIYLFVRHHVVILYIFSHQKSLVFDSTFRCVLSLLRIYI